MSGLDLFAAESSDDSSDSSEDEKLPMRSISPAKKRPEPKKEESKIPEKKAKKGNLVPFYPSF